MGTMSGARIMAPINSSTMQTPTPSKDGIIFSFPLKYAIAANA